jgi:hypothetical protein
MKGLDSRSRDKDGEIREKRGDTLLKNIRDDYPVLNRFNGNMRLDTLRDKLDVDSLDEALRTLRHKR